MNAGRFRAGTPPVVIAATAFETVVWKEVVSPVTEDPIAVWRDDVVVTCLVTAPIAIFEDAVDPLAAIYQFTINFRIYHKQGVWLLE